EVARHVVVVRPHAMHAAGADPAHESFPRHTDQARRIGRAIPQPGTGTADWQPQAAPDAAELIFILRLQPSPYHRMQPMLREAVQFVQLPVQLAEEPQVGPFVETPGPWDEVRHVTARADKGARAGPPLFVSEGSEIAPTHETRVPELSSGVEVRKSRGFSATDSTEFRAQLLAHGAVGRGCPEVILNRRRDVLEGEIFSEIGPFEAKDTEDIVPE